MKKILALMMALVLMVGLLSGFTLRADAAAEEDPYADLDNYTIKFIQISLEDEAPTPQLKELLAQIEEESHGHLTFDLTTGGSHIYNGEAEVYDLLKSDAYDMGYITAPYFSDVYDAIQVTNWVYLFDDAAHGLRFWNSDDAQQLYDRLEADTNLKVIAVTFAGTRNLTTKGLEVHSPEDLKGVKIRAIDSAISVAGVEAMGAIPVPITISELYTSLQTGIAQGQENACTVVETNKLYEVQDVINVTEHNLNFGLWVINTAAWDGLPAELQELLQQSFREYWPTFGEWIAEFNNDLMDKFEAEYGMTINRDVDRKAFAEAAEEAFYENYGDKEDWVELYEMIRSYAE